MSSYIRAYYTGKFLGKKYYNRRLAKLHSKNANRLQHLIVNLKGLLVKVGQLLSGLSNVLPDEYRDTLESLQDQAPPSNIANIKARLTKELGDAPENIFESFEEQPLASASIGQVHRAKLKDGTEVAVKVHHHNIEEIAELDLKIIEKLVGMIGRFFSIKGLDHVYGQIRQMILEELDYRHEAEVMQTIAENLKGDPNIEIPQTHPKYCTSKVLTTSFIEGVKLSNNQQLDDWGLDRDQIAKNLIHAFGQMILEDGFYHADPHPGNILVKKDGTIVLLDFGAVATLTDGMKDGIPLLILAVLRKDNDGAIKALRQMGFIGPGKEAQELAERLIETIGEFFSNEVEIKNLNLKDLTVDDIRGSSLDKLRQQIGIKKLTETIQIPEDWILLERTIVLLIGTCSGVAPEVDVLEEVKPQLKRIIFKNGHIKDIIIDAVKQQFTSLISIPTDLSKFLQTANKGKLEVVVKGQKEAVLLKHYHMQQYIYAIVTLAFIFFAMLHYRPHQEILLYSFSGAAALTAILFLRASIKAGAVVKNL